MSDEDLWDLLFYTSAAEDLVVAQLLKDNDDRKITKEESDNTSQQSRYQLAIRCQLFETSQRYSMSLACLVCHSVESPSHSFRSYSVSSSENEGRCSAIPNCLARRSSLPASRPTIASTSKVTPQPNFQTSIGMEGAPRLVRSRAVRRDLVRDWNFDEVAMER